MFTPPQNSRVETLSLHVMMLRERPLGGDEGLCVEPHEGDRGPYRGPREPPAHSVEVFTFDLHQPLSKERVEAFSDGVYAIVATLLILDIW